MATAAGLILGVAGTALCIAVAGIAELASIIFYQLLKKGGNYFFFPGYLWYPIHSPYVGIVAGENITIIQLAGLAIILFAVYITNRA